MTLQQDRTPGPGADEEDLPPTPATSADIAQWIHSAAWLSPYPDIPRARDDEPGAMRMVAADLTGGSLVVILEDGQVFRLTPEDLTRPSGCPARPWTLNPPGRLVTHASMDGSPLCERNTEGDTISAHWHEVTCLDCQLAAPAPDQGALDNLDHVLAEKQVRDVLTAASPQPLSVYDVLVQVERRFRAAVRPALDRLAELGTAELTGGPAPRWRLACR